MKSRDEFIAKAEELRNKPDADAVDREAAAILIDLAGPDPEDFVTESGAVGILREYERNNDPIVDQAIPVVNGFIW